jgi:hypothetical protein
VKVLGWILLGIGATFALLALDLINGNPELAAPGQPLLLGSIQGAWRFLFGFLALVAATLITGGVIALRGLPGLSYLALIVYLVLSLPYIILGGSAPSSGFALVLLVVLVIAVPVLVFVIASVIGKAVVKRRVPRAPAVV